MFGFLFAVIIVRSVGDHHVLRGKTAEVKEMGFCSMMRYLDTPVMLMKRNLSIVVLYNHLHILWLYVTGKQKVQFTIAGILECQADLMTELPQGMPLFFRTFQKCLKFFCRL